MWADESVFYQIYPLGFCGAPPANDGVLSRRIRKVLDWIPHIASLGANAVYFSPLFSSDAHGYDTRNYTVLDCRLGENKDFADVCSALHAQGIRVVLDGVFNHVGRGFWAFQDVLKNRGQSRYKDWFYLHFDGDSCYGDGLWYEGWEGHFELVKLNLQNDEVVRHIFQCIKSWAEQFDIDGLRLDVAYLLDKEFLKRLRDFCSGLKPDFFLLGELLGGDYNQLVNPQMLDSATNYECYKGLYSSFNSANLFEIAHSLGRQFGREAWTLYKGKHLFSFVDNHDVTRIASILRDKNHLPLLYALLFSMPGIPCVYYGSEWGAEGEKQDGDASLRPCFDTPQNVPLTAYIRTLAKIHRENSVLCYGDYQNVLIQSNQLVFERSLEGKRILVAVNAAFEEATLHFDARAGRARDLITGEPHDFGGGSRLLPYRAYYWEIG